MPEQVSDAELREDFSRVIEELGRVPTAREYDEIGAHTHETLCNHFTDDRSYNDAVEALGYEPPNTRRPHVSNSELRADFERVVEQFGRAPTWTEYNDHGNYSSRTLVRQFAPNGSYSYHEAVEELGYEPPSRTQDRTTDEQVQADFERVVELLGRAPTREEYKHYGKYSPALLAKRFTDNDTQSYYEALNTFGYETQPKKQHITTTKLRTDFEHLVEQLDRVPTTTEFDEHVEYTVGTFNRRFGDNNSYWGSAEALGYESPHKIATENLRKDLANVAEKLRHQPTRTEYDTHGTFPARTVAERLGTDGFTSVSAEKPA